MQFSPFLPVMILKKYTYTFYKVSKNIKAQVCTNRRIFLKRPLHEARYEN